MAHPPRRPDVVPGVLRDRSAASLALRLLFFTKVCHSTAGFAYAIFLSLRLALIPPPLISSFRAVAHKALDGVLANIDDEGQVRLSLREYTNRKLTCLIYPKKSFRTRPSERRSGTR